MKKYVYLGTSENLNHRGYSTDILYEITIYDDCFYIKVEIEARMDLKYLKHFKPLQELIKIATPKKVINGECQKCGGNAWGLFATKHKFCPNCGQMLDWSNK